MYIFCNLWSKVYSSGSCAHPCSSIHRFPPTLFLLLFLTHVAVRWANSLLTCKSLSIAEALVMHLVSPTSYLYASELRTFFLFFITEPRCVPHRLIFTRRLLSTAESSSVAPPLYTSPRTSPRSVAVPRFGSRERSWHTLVPTRSTMLLVRHC